MTGRSKALFAVLIFSAALATAIPSNANADPLPDNTPISNDNSVGPISPEWRGDSTAAARGTGSARQPDGLDQQVK